MSALSELNAIMEALSLPVETGVFGDKPPATYVVLTPFYDDFPLFGDNMPIVEVQSIRISLFDKGNYTGAAGRIVRALLKEGFTISDRRFVEHEDDTEYNHYYIDAEKYFYFERG